MAEARAVQRGAFGSLIQYWRKARRLSQLGLATEAEVSPRHLCFIETGRAKPSREMVLLLAGVLDLPLRERNELLLAAGFAPMYTESGLEAPALAAVQGALDAILRQQEPFPAVVMNRRWDLLRANTAGARFFGFLLGDAAARAPANILRMMFDPDALRPYVTNWEAVAEALVQRVHREAISGVVDDATRALVAEVLQFPGVPAAWKTAVHGVALVPVIPVSFRKADRTFDFFSTVTTLGTPQDVTVQEIRIECFFPADAATDRAARALARSASS